MRKLNKVPTPELVLASLATVTIGVLWAIYMYVMKMPEIALAGPILMVMGAAAVALEQFGTAAIVDESFMRIRLGKCSCQINSNVVTVGDSVFFQSVEDPDKFIRLETRYLKDDSLLYLGSLIRKAEDTHD